MITIQQCRAARGLLDWTQQDLADKAGLSKTAINNFEKGYSDIKGESLRAIRAAFEKEDVDFMGSTGLQKKTETAKILTGKTAFDDLLNDIEKTLPSAGELLISHIDSSFVKNYWSEKMDKIVRHCQLLNLPVRLLGTEESLTMLGHGALGRHLPPEIVKAGTMRFLYGRKTAFVLWGHAMIVLIESHDAADAEKKHFESLWATAQDISIQKKKARA